MTADNNARRVASIAWIVIGMILAVVASFCMLTLLLLGAIRGPYAAGILTTHGWMVGASAALLGLGVLLVIVGVFGKKRATVSPTHRSLTRRGWTAVVVGFAIAIPTGTCSSSLLLLGILPKELSGEEVPPDLYLIALAALLFGFPLAAVGAAQVRWGLKQRG